MQKEYIANEQMSFKDKSSLAEEKHGLRGVIQIYRKNKETGEVSFWDESENTIVLGGYQWILMKMFGLFLDSSHGKVTDDLTRDTTLAIPDLNNRMQIGVNPGEDTPEGSASGSIDGYTRMEDNIAVNHICQGFMIGNGGAGEDSVTTKNTSYSFINLRNPIPFRETTSTDTTTAGKYLGCYFGNEDANVGKIVKAAYIKKFDSTPHIYHSWWVDDQRWDYVDPVTQNYLGPDTDTTVWKTNRIETYVECKLSISDTDCQDYFKHAGVTSTAQINELGLVAFDTVLGERSIIETCYNQKIYDFLKIVYTAKGNKTPTSNQNKMFKLLATEIKTILRPLASTISQSNIQAFIEAIPDFTAEDLESDEYPVENYQLLQQEFSADSNIGAQAFYNQDDTIQYVEDNFLTKLQDADTVNLTLDEAQRIKLVTYYTFNSIPISQNWEILINYRIYAN